MSCSRRAAGPRASRGPPPPSPSSRCVVKWRPPPGPTAARLPSSTTTVGMSWHAPAPRSYGARWSAPATMPTSRTRVSPRCSAVPSGCSPPCSPKPCSASGPASGPPPRTVARSWGPIRMLQGCGTPPDTAGTASCWQRSRGRSSRTWSRRGHPTSRSGRWASTGSTRPLAPSPESLVPMYRTCAFCNGKLDGDGGPTDLGVGRRLAFDEWKGRLWVICPRCSRWNLAPLDDRLERIEALARAASDGRVAAATDQVALIRWHGYDLGRGGKPGRLEVGPWPYGQPLGAPRREELKFVLPMSVAALGLAVAVNVAAGGSVGVFVWNTPRLVKRIYVEMVGRRKIVLVEPPICERC